MFTVSLLIKIENYRPYKKIGRIINQKVPNRSIPLIIEDRFFITYLFMLKEKF